MKRRAAAALAAVVSGAWAAWAMGQAGGAAPATQPALVILQARWGIGQQWEDVTKAVQAKVQGDHLDMHVEPAAFPGNIAPRQRKTLQVTYTLNGVKKSEEFKGQTDAHIGPAAAVAQGNATGPAATEAVKGLVIVKAVYGVGNRQKDVTDELRAVVEKDSLTVAVGAAAFGDPAGGSSGKVLKLTYQDAEGTHNVSVPEGKKLQIGAAEAPTLARDGTLVDLTKRVAELREKYPTGMLVLDARFGTGAGWVDVTEQLQKLVKGNGLAVYVGHETFGDPAPGQAFQVLQIHYFDGKEIKYEEAAEGRKWGFGDGIAELAAGPGENGEGGDAAPGPRAGRGGARAGARAGRGAARGGRGATETASDGPPAGLEDLRKTYGDGLIIVSAKWEHGPYNTDVRAELQDAVEDNHVKAPATEEVFGNPDPSHTGPRTLQVAYWDGKAVQRQTIKQAAMFEANGAAPDALKGTAALPRVVVEGQALAAKLGVSGATSLVSGPAGLKVDGAGNISWTPAPADVGRDRVVIDVKADSGEQFARWDVQVMPATIAAAAKGDVSKMPGLVQMALAEKRVDLSANLDLNRGLILDGQKLRVVAGDGMTVVQELQLAKTYERVWERPGYFVGVRINPMILDTIDKATGKPLKTVPLSYQKLMDVAFMPGKGLTFVAVQAKQTVPRDRIVVVNEATGDVTEPKDLAGSFVGFDRTGQHLWVGLRDLYEQGMEYHINPDWSIIEYPTYGNIDMLLRFDMVDGTMHLRERIKDAGGNGTGIRVSPDGKRVTYLSFTGYPQQSKDLPGWDGLDFTKRPVEYSIKDKAEPTQLAYHPELPLVAIPSNRIGGGVLLFNRETGDTDEEHVHLTPLTLAGVRVKNALFSTDGENLILECERAGERFLYRCPLALTEAERAIIRAAPRAAPPSPSAPPARPGPGQSETLLWPAARGRSG